MKLEVLHQEILLQIKKLKSQLDQKNGADSGSSPDEEVAENGNDPNIMELQSGWSGPWKKRLGFSLTSQTNERFPVILLQETPAGK